MSITFSTINAEDWLISSDPDIERNSYQTIGNTSTDIEEWDGFHLKWIENTGNEASIGHAFYKMTNDDNNAYFYIDLRDAISSYSPNIYIKYNDFTGSYQYYDGSTFITINNGSILRIWQMKSSLPSTAQLEDYWDNVLLMVPDGIHPKLVYGPAGLYYKIYRKLGNGSYSHFTSSLNMDYTDTQYQFYTGDPPYYVYYKVKGETELTETEYSNEAYNSFHKSQKIAADNSYISYENELLQNFPNPYNPSTTISFVLKNPEIVTIKIYDILGREVTTLLNEKLSEGRHNLEFNASRLSSGVYLYTLTAGKYKATKKMQVLK